MSKVTVMLVFPDRSHRKIRLNERDASALFQPYRVHSETMRRIAREYGAVTARATYKGNFLAEYRQSEIPYTSNGTDT